MIKSVLNWIKNNPNRTMFLVPIILVAAISISHVVSWYDIANPISWAVYLSIAIEVGAMTALVAATNKIKGGVWFMFGLVTFIQMIGNIFYSYKEIDATGELFKSWVELTGPIWEMFGTDTNDVIGMKRWLAFLEGGLLPIISLTSLHFFTKYEPVKEKDEDSPIENKSEENEPEEKTEDSKILIVEDDIIQKQIIDEEEKVIEAKIENPSQETVEGITQKPLFDETPIEDVISEHRLVQTKLEPTTTTTTVDEIKRLKYVK